ncbi:MAG: hypothetical protein CM1200mP30_21240 [Pseudomonadota bacterium]|nr:MAG: hypothetical protein CM1200mP30_21240 [Pseudomonadota bacterium]
MVGLREMNILFFRKKGKRLGNNSVQRANELKMEDNWFFEFCRNEKGNYLGNTKGLICWEIFLKTGKISMNREGLT